MKYNENDILYMMEERLDREPLVFGAKMYSVGGYYDLSVGPYEEINEEMPELDNLYLIYW